MAGRFLRFIHAQNFRGQKRRLGTCQKISPVRVQDCAVVLNFEEKVLHHGARFIDAAIG